MQFDHFNCFWKPSFIALLVAGGMALFLQRAHYRRVVAAGADDFRYDPASFGGGGGGRIPPMAFEMAGLGAPSPFLSSSNRHFTMMVNKFFQLNFYYIYHNIYVTEIFIMLFLIILIVIILLIKFLLFVVIYFILTFIILFFINLLIIFLLFIIYTIFYCYNSIIIISCF
jgi:hypothetical protein